MTRDISLLSSPRPTAIAPAPGLHIAHVQLRDLVICPRERGLVNYVTRNSVVEQDLLTPRSTPRTLFDLAFSPANLTSLEVLNGGATLFAAGGQDAELHLSLHHHSTRQRRTGALEWRFEDHLQASINNSILLTSMGLGKSNESSIEPRLAISNNDCTIKFFDIPMAVRGGGTPKIRNAGTVRLNVAVNHSSLSPDGTCLLSVGDSSKVFLHRIYGGGQLSFSPVSTLTVPPPDRSLLPFFSSTLAASFSTAFSRDGTKYAVASQEGVVCVWDVRSTKPLKVYQTDKSDTPSTSGNGMASGFLSDDPYEWTRGLSKAPGWSARNVKFGSGGGDGCGKEIMTFTEHTSLLHVIDARTFETEEVIRVPSVAKQRPSSTTTTTRPPTSRRRSATVTESSTRFSIAAASLRPSAQSPASSQSPLIQRPVSNAMSLAASIVNPSHRLSSSLPTSSYSYSLPPTRSDHYQTPYVVLALEDTFRIPSRSAHRSAQGEAALGSASAAAYGASGGARRIRISREGDVEMDDEDGLEHEPDHEQDLVVIPPLGDREVEDDVRALLGGHGLRSRRMLGNSQRDETEVEDEDERMQVDGEGAGGDWDNDCVSSSSRIGSRAQSRSSSPALHQNRWRIRSRMEAPGFGRQEANNEEDQDEASEDDDHRGEDEAAGSDESQTNTLTDLDIAGTCFDPSGGYIYVATTTPSASFFDLGMGIGVGVYGDSGRKGVGGLVEWKVRGSGKRWWVDSVDSERGGVWC
ncbi:hypothetical protein D9757_004946 [Collybiopsis confluens]|uniref:DUF2415 domain-containing protein n=1 Tax=Collybiopsis confluens TaxID=2823264 RepID=A0A8H5HTF7_9AGAR|nr:hypothetical protein D9757_004946 [Collybiopsis confluens]